MNEKITKIEEEPQIAEETPAEEISVETVDATEETQTFEEQDKEDQVIEKEEPCKKRDSKSWSLALTKTEGFVMFIAILFIMGVCTFALQFGLTNIRNDMFDYAEELANQVEDLELHVDSLEAQIESLETEIANMELETKLYQIGLYDPNTGAQVGFYDPYTGTIIDQTVEEAPFDTSAFLGVAFMEGNDGSDNPIGLQIDYVYPFSPAELAGIKAGDIIMAVNGVKIDTLDDMTTAISQCAANDTIEVQLATVVEDGSISVVTLPATLTYRGNFEID